MIKKLFVLFMTMIFISSCEDKKAGPSQRAQQQLTDKIENYSQKIQKRCLDKICKRAETDVDSFLLRTAKERKIKNIKVPSIVRRPEKPEVEFPEFIEPK